jgi:hypothetical protein
MTTGPPGMPLARRSTFIITYRTTSQRPSTVKRALWCGIRVSLEGVSFDSHTFSVDRTLTSSDRSQHLRGTSSSPAGPEQV